MCIHRRYMKTTLPIAQERVVSVCEISRNDIHNSRWCITYHRSKRRSLETINNNID